MGPEVFKGQNGLPHRRTLLAHDGKSLAIDERSLYLLEISTQVQWVSVETFSFHNNIIIIKPPSFLLLFYFLKFFY